LQSVVIGKIAKEIIDILAFGRDTLPIFKIQGR